MSSHSHNDHSHDDVEITENAATDNSILNGTTKSKVDNDASNGHHDILHVNIADGIATITLNQPKTLNALSIEMLDKLGAAIDDITNDSAAKVIILKGEGNNFCAGHNLKDILAHKQDEDDGLKYFQFLLDKCASVMSRIVHCPKPVIAAVRGIATAGGCQLVASCDLAVASHNAKFAVSGVNIGLFCATPMVALSRNLSRKHAMEMLLLGEFISPEKAKEFGLVNRVVADEQLEIEAQKIAAKIASKSPIAIKIGKEAFYHQAEMKLEEAYKFASQAMATNMMTNDAEAGISAFISKNTLPKWQGN